MSPDVAKQNLTAKQRRAADVLIAGGSKERAADAAGVTVRTIERYLNEPVFAEAIRDGARQAMQKTAMRITSLLDLALSVMYETMTDPGQKSGIKLRAANYTITHAIKLMELSDVLTRIEAIEARLGG
jgi:phage terminase small subunit